MDRAKHLSMLVLSRVRISVDSLVPRASALVTFPQDSLAVASLFYQLEKLNANSIRCQWWCLHLCWQRYEYAERFRLAAGGSRIDDGEKHQPSSHKQRKLLGHSSTREARCHARYWVGEGEYVRADMLQYPRIVL